MDVATGEWLAQQIVLLKEKTPPWDNADAWMCYWPLAPMIRLFFRGTAKRNILRQAYRDPRREIGGVLIGEVYRPPNENVLTIDVIDAIPGPTQRHSLTSFTFTPETWTHIHEERQIRFPHFQMVGWYHTHPGHDVFLSRQDLFIHNNFFTELWHVALVVDHTRQRARFYWGQGAVGSGIEESVLFTWDKRLVFEQGT